MNQNQILNGHVVLVTGGGRGIDAAIALAAAHAGARVAIAARSDSSTVAEEITGQGGKALVVRGDVADADDAERMVAETVACFGRIDVLINNAALLETAPLLETTVESFERVMSVNVRGVLLMMQAAGRRMVEQRSGVIVTIGSDLAMRGRANYATYTTSKGAALQLTRTAAIELGASGVRVVMLSPAVTNTDLARPALEDPKARADLLAKGTLGVINEPADVAAAAVFLASPLARTVTGCNWPVDAGVLAR